MVPYKKHSGKGPGELKTRQISGKEKHGLAISLLTDAP